MSHINSAAVFNRGPGQGGWELHCWIQTSESGVWRGACEGTGKDPNQENFIIMTCHKIYNLLLPKWSTWVLKRNPMSITIGNMTLNTSSRRGTWVPNTVPWVPNTVPSWNKKCGQMHIRLYLSLYQTRINAIDNIHKSSSGSHSHFQCCLGTRDTWRSKSAWMAKRTCRDSVYNQIMRAVQFSQIMKKRFIRWLRYSKMV